jgi:hypothetical protein
MFNLLTDNSFRVRLVDMTYYDIAKNKRLHSSLGFFIGNCSPLSHENCLMV